MPRDKKITWSLDAVTSKLTSKLDELESKFDKTGGKGFNAFRLKLAAGITAAVLSLTKLVSIASEYISLSDKQVAANTKVEQAVRSTGAAAGISADELGRVAQNLQELTAIGDEDILKSVTAQLLTFTNITQDNFLKTQEAVLNVASVLSNELFPTASELKAVSLQLGKALNDPVANLGALSRSGIQFSEGQKKVIKELANTNRLAEAQSIILEELNKQYGGQAKATADAVGQLQKAENSYNDLRETIGGLIKDGLKPAAAEFKNIVENVNDIIKQPVSEKIEDEQIALNGLVTAIISTNKNEKLRNDLIQELQKTYPGFLKNLDAEKVTNEELAKRLAQTNKQLLNKIILQRADEKRIKALESQADAYEAQYNATKRLSTSISQVSKEYNINVDSQKSLTEQAKELIGVLNQSIEKSIFQGSILDKEARTRKELQQGILLLNKTTKDYDKTNADVQIKAQEIVDLQKELGISIEDATKAYEDFKQTSVSSLNNVADASKKAADNIDEANKKIIESLRNVEKFQENISNRIAGFYEDRSRASENELANEERKIELLYDLGQITNEQYRQILQDRLDFATDFYGKDSEEYLRALQEKQGADKERNNQVKDLLRGLTQDSFKSFDDFLVNIEGRILQFMQSQAIEIFLNLLTNIFTGGTGSILSGTIFGGNSPLFSFNKSSASNTATGIVSPQQNVGNSRTQITTLNIDPLLKEIQNLRADVQVLQNPQIVAKGADIYRSYNRTKSKIITN